MYKKILLITLILVFLFSFNVFAQNNKTGVNLLTPEEKPIVSEFLKKGSEVYYNLENNQIKKDYDRIAIIIKADNDRRLIVFEDVKGMVVVLLYVDEVMEAYKSGTINKLAFEYAIKINSILTARYPKNRILAHYKAGILNAGLSPF